TVKLALALFPCASVAMQSTVVVRSAKVLPEVGVQVTGTELPQLSVALPVNVIIAPAAPVAWPIMLAGIVRSGGVLSTTVTVAVQELLAPWLSVAVSVTVVFPTEYGPAGDWLNVMKSPASGW